MMRMASTMGLFSSLLLCLAVLLSLASLSSSSASPSVPPHRHARQGLSPSAPPPPLGPFPWFNYSLSLDARATALVSALTVREKLSLMSNKQPAIQRLGLPYYDFESEGSHGVARAGRATVFPSPIALASTFSTDVSYRAGRVVSMEGRGKFNDYTNKHGGNNTRWYTLDFLAPNINLFLHPRWGRGQETYGEDPYLTGEMSSAYVLGIQNWDPSNSSTTYVEAGATCKHFFGYGDSVYNNNVTLSETDIQQTYHVAFKACIQKGKARSIMCAYSTVNGYQSCEHPALKEVVRDEWGFDGFICSDAGAVGLIKGANNTIKATKALKSGVDQDLDGGEYSGLTQALELGLIEESDLDVSLTRVFKERMRTGQLDPPELSPYSQFDLSVVDLPASRALARQAAREGSVLLKNDGGVLPIDLSSSALRNIAVVGPNADRLYTLLGNYDGCTEGDGQDPPIDKDCVLITPLAAIREAVNATNADSARSAAPISLTYQRGVDINSTDRSGVDAAVSAVKAADVAIVVMGIRTCAGGFGKIPIDCIEGEMLDRQSLELPGLQPQLMRLLIATGTPLVLVTMSGSPLGLNEWHWAPSVLAIVQHWYSGEEGGHGLTDLLFGAYSPSGRLPVSWPLDDSQIPAEANYSMTATPGRSYRYSTVIPAYSFGFGLSYTQWRYTAVDSSTPLLTPAHFPSDRPSDASVTVRFSLANVGGYRAMEVVQLYSTYTSLTLPTALQSIPRTELKAFTKVEGGVGQVQGVSLRFNVSALALVGPDGRMAVQPGVYLIHVGGAAPGSRGALVDGEDQHGRVVRQKRPVEVRSVGACQAANGWWEERMEGGADGMAAVEVEQAIAGGLVGVLTIC